MDFNFDPVALRLAILQLLIAIISFTLHEWGHAKMADLLGDDTPRSQGRVTLNPLAHIDLLGTIIIPLLGAFGFFGRLGVIGWAKPVYTDPRNFKNGKADQALVTIAGPAMNVVLAFIATLLAVFAHRLFPSAIPLLSLVIEINMLLLVFNLLPIPPLDGSKFLMYWFGMSEETYHRFSQFGGFVLLALVNVPQFQRWMMFLVGVGISFFELIYRTLAS